MIELEAREVTPEEFQVRLCVVRGMFPHVEENTDGEYNNLAICLMVKSFAGVAITGDGELVGLFNVGPKGLGGLLVDIAVQLGAQRLNCFEGLVPFYARHGFEVVGREPNWTPGGPDVVFMEVN